MATLSTNRHTEMALEPEDNETNDKWKARCTRFGNIYGLGGAPFGFALILIGVFCKDLDTMMSLMIVGTIIFLTAGCVVFYMCTSECPPWPTKPSVPRQPRLVVSGYTPSSTTTTAITSQLPFLDQPNRPSGNPPTVMGITPDTDSNSLDNTLTNHERDPLLFPDAANLYDPSISRTVYGGPHAPQRLPHAPPDHNISLDAPPNYRDLSRIPGAPPSAPPDQTVSTDAPPNYRDLSRGPGAPPNAPPEEDEAPPPSYEQVITQPEVYKQL